MKKRYCVDVFRTYAHCVEIEADNREDAENKVYDMVRDGKIDLADFELTDDIDVECHGEEDEDGNIVYD